MKLRAEPSSSSRDVPGAFVAERACEVWPRWVSRDQARQLIELLALDVCGVDRFRASNPHRGRRWVSGGQIAAQALRAACHTVDEGRRPHSMHAFFLRRGRPGVPIDLEVDRTRDGGSFATRAVRATQGGRVVLEMIASFQAEEPGFDWQDEAAMPSPAPDDIEPLDDLPFIARNAMFDIRPTHRSVDAETPSSMPHPFWIRHRAPLGDDPVGHACVLTYLTDIALMGTARAPGSSASPAWSASLDHSIWFHRPVRSDEWLLFSADPISNAAGRGLAIGTLRTQAGALVASVAQEALLRGGPD
jgi:acyl-CoA thioesterase-2